MFIYILIHICDDSGLPRWLSKKESACQCRRHEFNPWSGKIPHAVTQLSLCTTTVEPVLQMLWTASMKPEHPRACVQVERPPQGETHLPQLKKSSHSSEDPLQPPPKKPLRVGPKAEGSSPVERWPFPRAAWGVPV